MKDAKPITRNGPPRMATIAAGLLIGSVVCVSAAKAQVVFTDAITREVTVFNKLPTPPPNEAISREATLLNNLSGVMLHPIDDAITREVTVFNKLPAPFTDANTREVTLLNNLSILPKEAITREVTLLNNLSGVMLHPIDDAITREVTIFNNLSAFSVIDDAATREFTILNTILCTGDFNNDFAVTVADIPLFAAVMTDPNPHPAALLAADLNCDGITNGLDVQAFVDALLAP